MTYVVGEVNSARVYFWCDFASREHLRNRDVGAGGSFRPTELKLISNESSR